MTKKTKMERLNDANEEFKNSIISHNTLGSDRYTYSKSKTSQAPGATANVVVIKDNTTDIQYTISVNVSAVEFRDDGKTYTTDDRLNVIQKAVTEFLTSIHETL